MALVMIGYIYTALIISFDGRQEKYARNMLANNALVLQSTLVSALLEGDTASVRRSVMDQALLPDVSKAILLGEDGRVVASSRLNLLNNALPTDMEGLRPDALTHVRESMHGTIVKSDDDRFLISVFPVVMSREFNNFHPAHVGLMITFFDLKQSISELHGSVLATTLKSAIFVLIILLTAGLIVNQVVTTRIDHILDVTKSYLGGNRRARIGLHGRSELAEIGMAFDRVIDSIEEAQTNLERSKQSLDNAQRIAHIGSWDWDIARGTLMWTDEIYRIFGLQPQEFDATYEAFLERIHPDDRDPVSAAVNASLERPVPYSIEHRVVQPDGTERIVQEQGEIIRDDAGVPIFMSGTVQDITERKMVERDLTEAREGLEQKVQERTQELATEKSRAERYLNIAGTIIVALDQGGNLLLVNKKGREVLGYEADSLIGKNWFETVIPADHRDELGAMFRRMLKGEIDPVDSNENHIVTGGGELRLISWNNTYMRDEEGHIVGSLSAGEDITERRKAEDALSRSEQQLSKVQAIAGLGNWIWNIAEGTEVWSDQQFRIFGYDPGEVEASYQLFLDAIHPDDRDRVLVAVDQALHQNKPYNQDFRIIWPSGEERFIVAHGELECDAEGTPSTMVGTVLDITDRKAIESKLVQSTKMATLGEMATGVAHELNQPLNVIRMAVSNIQRKATKGSASPEYISGKLGKVEQQVERATAIIDHMRIFGRRADINPGVLDPKKVVEGTLGLIGEQLRLAGIQVRSEVPEECASFIGHQVQVEQVLLNLLGNARDQFRDRDGEKQISIRILQDDDNVSIAVEDSAGGIPSNVLSRVFEPFFTTKEVGTGTGLGLSISYGIVVEMGGVITVENGAKGALFTLTVPIATKDEQGLYGGS